MAAMEVRLPVARKLVGQDLARGSGRDLVAPGDTITTDTGYMRWGGAGFLMSSGVFFWGGGGAWDGASAAALGGTSCLL